MSQKWYKMYRHKVSVKAKYEDVSSLLNDEIVDLISGMCGVEICP